jgi:hypothetical protein
MSADVVVVREVMPSEILDRIEKLEVTNDALNREIQGLRVETKDMLAAFQAAQGAFMFLEWLARAVKPILFIGATVGGFIFWLKGAK